MSIKMTGLRKTIKRLHKGPNPDQGQKYSIEQFIYGSYIKAWQMMREKRNELLSSAQQMKGHNSGSSELFYNVPRYLETVCDMLRRLLGRIALIDYRNITVMILYQIPEQDEQWKCIEAAGEPQVTDVSKFINMQDKHFLKLVKGDILSFCIENPKEGEEGEFFGTRIDFESLEEKFVNGILLISTRGQTFRNVNQYCETEGKSFESVLVYSILPYFAEMIETEFGVMYLWEQWKRK